LLDAALKPTRWELSAPALKLVVCRNTALGGEVIGQPQAAGTFLGRRKRKKRRVKKQGSPWGTGNQACGGEAELRMDEEERDRVS